MDASQRKQAIRTFKERKPVRGAFSIRCAVSGESWVGASPNIPAARNANWFSLRSGIHRERPLQEAWNAHGELSFEFSVLEELKDDANPLTLRDDLQQLKRKWAADLSAHMLL